MVKLTSMETRIVAIHQSKQMAWQHVTLTLLTYANTMVSTMQLELCYLQHDKEERDVSMY